MPFPARLGTQVTRRVWGLIIRGAMTPDEHRLVLWVFVRQAQTTKALLDILKSREILQDDDAEAFAASVFLEASNSALYQQAKEEYLKIAKLLGVETGLKVGGSERGLPGTFDGYRISACDLGSAGVILPRHIPSVWQAILKLQQSRNRTKATTSPPLRWEQDTGWRRRQRIAILPSLRKLLFRPPWNLHHVRRFEGSELRNRSAK